MKTKNLPKFKVKCEICKERKAKTLFIHTLSNPIQDFLLCEECVLNFLAQFYNVENNELPNL